MSKDTLKILKKVILYDAVIALLSLVISIFFFKAYTAAVMVGIVISVINFILNAVITNYAMKTKAGAALTVIGAVARVAIAGACAMLIYRSGSVQHIVAFLIGYSLHYLAVIGAAIRVR